MPMDGEPRSMSSCRNIIITELAPPAMRKRDSWCIDQFDLQKRIGGGYASVVYLATCQMTGNQVAMKVYQKSKLNDLTAFQIFREIRIHSRLDHKNILQLWAAFEDDYAIYMATEYAAKGDVFCDVERRGGSMSEVETVQQVLHPFLQALVYLHERKIMHRDIKPENLLFTSTGVLKVADFGLSIEFDKEHAVTRVGTLDYMAPEVVVCPEKHTPSDNKEVKHLRYSPVVDSWAVGVLAYELCVGSPPFDRGHKKQTISEILYGDAKLPPSLSEQAGDFICWALTKNKHMRPTVQRLLEHPWITSHMSQSVRGGGGGGARPFGRHMRFVESFGAQRSLGAKELLHKPPASVLDGAAPGLLVQGVRHRSRALGRSLSLGASDLVRRRNIDFDTDPATLMSVASVAAPTKRRMSDCAAAAADELVAAAAAAAVAPPPARCLQHLSFGSRGAATPLLLSPPQGLSRAQVFARLQASAAELNQSLGSRGGSLAAPSPASQRNLEGSPAAAAAAAEAATLQAHTPVKAQLGPWSRSPRSARMQQKVHSQGSQPAARELPPGYHRELPPGYHRASEQTPPRTSVPSSYHYEGQTLMPSLSSEGTPEQVGIFEREHHTSAPMRALRSATAPTFNFAFFPKPPTSAHSRSSMPFSFPSQPATMSAHSRSSMPFASSPSQPATSSAALLPPSSLHPAPRPHSGPMYQPATSSAALLPPSSLHPAPRPHSGPMYSPLESLTILAPPPAPGPISPPHQASPPAQQASPPVTQRSSPRVHQPMPAAQQPSPAAPRAPPPPLQVPPPTQPSASASLQTSPASQPTSSQRASPNHPKPSSPASQAAGAAAPVATPLTSPLKAPSLLAQTFASIIGSRESSFTCRKPAATAVPTPERGASVTALAAPARSPSASRKHPAKPGQPDASAVPMLLQSAKDMLGNLQKVFS